MRKFFNFNPLRAFSSIGLFQTKPSIHWQTKYGGIFIKFPIQRLNLNTLFFTHSQMRFKHLIVAMNLNENQIVYPAGIDQEAGIVEFLNDWKAPRAIEISYDGKKQYLKNKACQRDSQLVLKTIKSPTSIYGHLFKYVSANPSEKTSSGDINYFLNHFYLRLTAQAYCFLNKIDLKTKMTPELSQNILNFIGQQFKNSSPAQIKDTQTNINLVKSKIEGTMKQINIIQEQGNKVIKLYKYAAIFVTTVHIVTFYIMIFHIQWLGWDIVEPLTYSATVIYTLLGIRFYKKFKVDRTSQTVKEVLLNATMKPKKLLLMKELRERVEIHNRQLQRLEAKIRILKNRINFKTSLCSILRGKQTEK